MKRRNGQNKNTSFDPDRIKRQFERTVPKIIAEFADLIEQPVP